MPNDLTMRRTVIGGETALDDYAVIWDELSIGQIFRAAWASAASTGGPGRSSCRTCPIVTSTVAAPAALTGPRPASVPRGAICSDSYDEICKAREIQGRRRPWHR